MKKTLFLLLTIMLAFNGVVKANHWETPLFGYYMGVTGVITIDGVEQQSDMLEIGAFCGDECRGSYIADVFPISNQYVVSLSIGSNSENGNETISFKIYDHSVGQELDLVCHQTVNFVNMQYIGNYYQGWYDFAFKTQYTVSVSVDPVGAGTVSGAGTYDKGTSVTVTAMANSGYQFLNWTDNDNVITDNPYTFTLTGDKHLVANYYQSSYYYEPVVGLQYNMTVSGIILIDNVEQNSDLLEVGAFCGNECRGREIAIYFPPTNQYVVPIVICSDEEEGDTITFKLYDHDAGIEMDVLGITPLIFEKDAMIGNVENWYHFEFGSLYQITVVIDPEGSGTVLGTGGHYWGTTATLTAIGNNGFSFWKWMIGDEFVSMQNPYSFTVTGNVVFIAKFTDQQTSHLNAGWNWWSTYIEQQGIDGLTLLENSLGDYGMTIWGQYAYVQNQSPAVNNYWWGGLNYIENESSYRIQVSDSCTITMAGRIADPSEHPITIMPGWTWIGYPVTMEQTPEFSMGSFEPIVDDVLKGHHTFAQYYENYGWFPPTFVLTPGLGYMYYSHATDNKTLVYTDSNRNRGDDNLRENSYWNNKANTYSDNICMIATANILGVEQRGENYEVGAFVDGECRGSSRLMYFEPLDRYYAMITIVGVDGDKVEFSMVDTDNNRLSDNSLNGVVFESNAIIGSLDNPYEIAFSEMNDINFGNLVMFPNPVERNKSFTMNVPNDEIVKGMVITNAIGAVVKVETHATKIMQYGMPVSGVYMVKAICESGNIFVGKLIVK